MRKVLLTAMAATAFVSAPAAADVIVTLGDRDCFGLGGSCPDGTLWRDDLGGVFFTDYKDVGDPEGTDEWDSFDTIDYVFDYGAVSASSVEVELRIAGIADDDRGPYSVTFNAVEIGEITSLGSANDFQLVRTFIFNIDTALLTGSDALFSLTNDAGDGYALDFVELRIAEDAVTVPAPGAIGLLGLGLLGLAVRRRRSV